MNLLKSVTRGTAQFDINSCLCQHVSSKTASLAKKRVVPLVILLPWLGASQGAIEKYVTLYKNCGCDVMVKQSTLLDFLWPKLGLKNSALFLKKVMQNIQPNERPIVVHSTSIGSYFYALMLLQMKNNPDMFSFVTKNIQAQVVDSPVVGTLKEMAIGVSTVSTSNRWASIGYSYITQGYFALTKPFTVQLYKEVIDVIKYHAPKVPSLILSSTTDKLALPEALQDFIKSWKDADIPTSSKIWTDSEHAQHLKLHPDLYKQMVYKLLFDAFGDSVFFHSKL